MTKTVLCYGDSNTYGAAIVPRPDDRYAFDERWPGALATALGSDWRVIEEGLNGRTTVWDDPVEGACRNGKTYLTPCLYSHRPLDVVAIMLGTNDLKSRFQLSAWDIASGVATLVDIVLDAKAGRNGSAPAVIIIAPPPFLSHIPTHGDMFAGAQAKSREMAARYQAVAREKNVFFIDAGQVVSSSPIDGFHLEPEANKTLGSHVAAKIKEFLV